MGEVEVSVRALIIQTVLTDRPGRITELMHRRGWEVDLRVMEAGDQVPPTDLLPSYHVAVLLGGPMSVHDRERYPYLEEIARLSGDLLRFRLPTLGICLGAQFLALAQGSRVYKSRVAEIGFYEVELTPSGRQDPLFRGIASRFTVFQWHEDTFELPEGATLLATAHDCRNQVIRCFPRQYGLQFHIELTQEMITEWVDLFGDEIVAIKGPGSDEVIRREMKSRLPAYYAVQEQLINNFLDLVEEKPVYTLDSGATSAGNRSFAGEEL